MGVIIGALIGFFILGPIGAIVGAMVGLAGSMGGKKK